MDGGPVKLPAEHPILVLVEQLFLHMIEAESTMALTTAKLETGGGFQMPLTIAIAMRGASGELVDLIKSNSEVMDESTPEIKMPEAN